MIAMATVERTETVPAVNKSAALGAKDKHNIGL
jgi:hypothetical protein